VSIAPLFSEALFTELLCVSPDTCEDCSLDPIYRNRAFLGTSISLLEVSEWRLLPPPTDIPPGCLWLGRGCGRDQPSPRLVEASFPPRPEAFFLTAMRRGCLFSGSLSR